MSFGFSPSDVVKLVEISARIYVAFKDANNSEAQVSGLVREFSSFHHCLVELSELMKEYGKPLPFPYLDFRETLKRCEASIETYANNLVDRRMSVKKFVYTIKFIGKEKDISNLRAQITGHYQALQMCISFLQLRLHLEAAKQTQRLLDLAPLRTMSFGGHYYTTNALGDSSRAVPNALPAPSEADQLYKDWLVFSRWLKNEDERLALQASNSTRPLSFGDTPAVTSEGNEQTAAVLYHLRRELEDAIMIEENRAKRIAVESRTSLSPSDATKREVRNIPPIPLRTYTLGTEHSGNFSRFKSPAPSMNDSTTTVRATPNTPPLTSPTGSPQIPQSNFAPVDWGRVASPSSESSSGVLGRRVSISTDWSSVSTSTQSRLSVGGLGISTMATTPEEVPFSLHRNMSTASLASLALGPGALQWNKLCRRVHVERNSLHRTENRECDLHWRYREDAGISIRSVYRSEGSKEAKVWITQHFPATGPSIPSTTSFPDGDISVDFPRASFGRLEKKCTDIKYTFADTESSTKLQTLLYTNNGKEEAELLYDRPVVTVSSDLNKPECRGKNIRLWRKKEVQGLNDAQSADTLVLLFYTTALAEEKAHWVEEPHRAFQLLDESVYAKKSDRLLLTFSKESGKWTRDKMFQRRKSSKSSDTGNGQQGVGSLNRSDTVVSWASSSAASVKSATSLFGAGRPGGAGTMNRFGYSELEIKFQSKTDRSDFLDVWRTHVRALV